MIRKANLKQEGFKVMGEIIIPQGYKSALNLHDTQVAIKTVKDYFQHELTHRLHLLRVTAPLFVQPETGLNDNLNGVEHPVSFELKDQGTKKTAELFSLWQNGNGTRFTNTASLREKASTPI